MKIAFCFAGQGSQYVGMGRDFYENEVLSKKYYDQFPEIRDLCFFDKSNQINQTKFAQKAILLTSYSIAKLLQQNDIIPEYVCGLSLGEYTALTFSNVWSLKDAIDIVSKRGEIMQTALPLNTSKMAAIIGLNRDDVLNELRKVNGICEIANYNCPGQIVITGENQALDEAVELLKPVAKSVIPLNVSGAFHCSLLKEAAAKLREVLDNYNPIQPIFKVVYNVNGSENQAFINDILQQQIYNSVYFEDSIEYMIKNGVDTFIEIGPGKVLSNFIRKINKQVNVYNVSKYEDIEKVYNFIKK